MEPYLLNIFILQCLSDHRNKVETQYSDMSVFIHHHSCLKLQYLNIGSVGGQTRTD